MKRQYDLDWIRVIATLAVFIYHCLMFFNPWAWHVKNSETDPTYITALSLFMSTWLMPIFFAVSGINSYYALQKKSGRQYIKERLAWLGIPLLFGVMILTPPQIYMERVSHGQFSGSFLSWYPRYFDGVYLDIGGSGNFAFVGLHLWYLLVLLIFSLITLPFFLNLKPSISKELKPLHVFVLSFPLIIISILLDVVMVGADYVFTGEGSIDGQTLFGKTPFGVASIARKYSIPVIAFAGRIGNGVEPLYEHGFTSIIGILKGVSSLDEALKSGEANLEFAAENICRILKS
jgi:fucose 4-O-acetylase-like acetyltransferase